MIEIKVGQIWEPREMAGNSLPMRYRIALIDTSYVRVEWLQYNGLWWDRVFGTSMITIINLHTCYKLVEDAVAPIDGDANKVDERRGPGECGQQINSQLPTEAPFFVWLDINHPRWHWKADYSLSRLGELLAAYEAGQASKR